MRKNDQVIAVAFIANVVIAVAKIIGAFVTGSASLAAEAVHSCVDSGNEILLYVGSRKAQKPPTKRHPLGHGREMFFWSFVVAVMLFSIGGLYSIFEGVERLKGNQFKEPVVSFAILAIAAVSEGYSFRTVVRRIKERIKQRHAHINFYEWFKRSTATQLLVVFTEDFGALIGIVFAALGVGISWITGNHVWDAVGSIAVGSLLVFMAVALAIQIKSLIVGEAPSRDYRQDIQEMTERLVPGAKLKQLFAVQGGPDEVIMSYKISSGDVRDARDLVRRINTLEKKIKEKFPEIRWLFISPSET